MKRKIHKILGIGLTISLVLSLGLVFSAAPAAADDDEWSAYDIPLAGADGDYFMDTAIDAGPGPIARDIDGNFWTYVSIGAAEHIMKSLDNEGSSWEATDWENAPGTAVVDIVCSTLDSDVAYAVDAADMYKTEDGGDSWAEVGNWAGGDILCLAVGWDEDDDPRVFAGDDAGDVYYLYDIAFGQNWTDLTLDAPAVPTDIFGISVSPDFADDAFQVVLAIDADETFLAYHVGSDPGGWDSIELLDLDGVNFLATDSSDPAFPEDFNGDDFYDEDTEIFVGAAGVGADGAAGDDDVGGVWRIYGVDAGDFEVLDNGDLDVDIADLAIVGNLTSVQMLAGADGDNDVWYSWDDGDDWDQASAEGIAPAGGAVDTYVLMDAAFDEDAGVGWAATGVANGGFHTTIDGGTSWQGTGLLDTEIDNLHAAEVVVSSPEMVYLVTDNGGNAEAYRYDSATEIWDRIYEESSQYTGLGDMDLIGVYGDTIVLADAGTTNIAFSSDGGQTFAEPDEEPTSNIQSLLLLDEETWWVGDTDGELWVTDDAGDRSWDEYEIEGTDAITSLAVRGDEAIAGTADAEAYYSEDAGETWDQVGGVIDATLENTYVCFDSGNDNSDVIYAASDNTLARFQYLTTDLEEDWEAYTTANLDAASGIACMEGVLYASTGNAADGVVRVVEPLYDLDDAGESDVDDPVDDGITTALDGGIIVTSSSPNTIYGINIGGEDLWTYTDLMVGPLTGGIADPGDTDAILTWDGFDNATDYEVWVYSDEDMRAVYELYAQDTGDDEPLLILDGADAPDAGTQYWWQARASAPVHSKWSAVFNFSTDPGAVGIDEDTLAPQLGAMNVPTDTPFSWGFDEDADSYLIEISDSADFSNILDSATVTVPAYQSAVTLNECTNYWYRVQAIAGGQSGNFSYASFTTVCPDAVAPTPPAAAPSTPVEVIQETITPNYIYAIIGIGAALAILVIVLIVKTRRS